MTLEFEEDGVDQSEDGLVVREGADDVGSA